MTLYDSLGRISAVVASSSSHCNTALLKNWFIFYEELKETENRYKRCLSSGARVRFQEFNYKGNQNMNGDKMRYQ